VRLPLFALAAALAFVALARLGGAHWRGAMLGAALSGVAGVASVLAMGLLSRGGQGSRLGVNGALAVMGAGFLVRLVLVAAGTFAVVKAGESVAGFVVGFFVPFFALVSIEALYVHRLGRGATP
jgi:hypothetical protein